MAIKYADSIRNAQNTALITDVGTSPVCRVYSGTIPADETTALSGNPLLAEGTLPSTWATTSAGVLTKSGTWTLTGQTGASTGTAGTFFRIFASGGTTSKIQGSFGVGADMVPDNNSIANAQTVTVSTFTLTRGN